jgi:uncharacterized protein YjbI with pentapeptide repeats
MTPVVSHLPAGLFELSGVIEFFRVANILVSIHDEHDQDENTKLGQAAQTAQQTQQQAAHDLLISNQVSKGFEQLAGEKLAMRLGGIYALEGVMNDKTSPQYHQPVLEALCAFVRETSGGNTKKPTTDGNGGKAEKLATDVQAALTVVGRRAAGPGQVDLGEVSIPGADLSGANLSDANFIGADLSGANLSSANLSGAELTRANLSDAGLIGANLSGADLSIANLSNAWLGNANLGLSGADLSGAILFRADLRHANLSGAILTGANLSGADLSGARELTQTQLDEACGDANTKPPEGLKPPKPCQAAPR